MAQSNFNICISGKMNFEETRQSEALGDYDENGARLVEVVTTPKGNGSFDVQIQGNYVVDDRLLDFMEKAAAMDSRSLELLLPVVEKVMLAYFKR